MRSRTDLPERYADRTLEGFDPSVSTSAAAALEAARDLAEGRIRSLVLIGRPGVGKTHLAAGAIRAWEARRGAEAAVAESAYQASMAAWRSDHPDPIEARILGATPPARPEHPALPTWVNVPSLLIGLREEFGAEARPAHARAEAARSTPELVVLDDIGREKSSDWTSEVLYELVNTRYEAMRPTMATSNLSGEELVAAGYWPVVSRLAEDGRLIVVEAPDRRIRRTR